MSISLDGSDPKSGTAKLADRQRASLKENERLLAEETAHREAQRATSRRALDQKITRARAGGRTKGSQVSTRRANLPSNARGRR